YKPPPGTVPAERPQLSATDRFERSCTPPLLSRSAVDECQRPQTSTESSPERLEQDPIPEVAGRLYRRLPHGKRDESGARGAHGHGHSVHLVLAGRRILLRDGHARCRG